MRNPELVLNNLAAHSKVSDYKYERLYRLLFNEEMFFVAYQRIYAKQGNMTAGTDGKTIDGMSLQRIESLIMSLKSEAYKPNPARRVYIPKKNGGKRPLGIPSVEDKLVQEVIRMILEAIYEGAFQSTSHGFRLHKSCHTALKDIQINFKGAKWFIEGDIKGFFDNIDHEILIAILRERISDERFLRLIRKFLKAGYMEDWTYNKTFSGTPQGGIISPILANIYLDKFDKYMKQYAQEFDKGVKRRTNPEYNVYRNRMTAIQRKLKVAQGDTERQSLLRKLKATRAIMVTIPYGMSMDEKYRRLKYVRYADDFLIGVIGTKAECVNIKEDITKFMKEILHLEMSQEKTLITHSEENAHFLGYDIHVQKSDLLKRNGNGDKARIHTGTVVLKVPVEAIKSKLKAYKAVEFKTVNGREVWWPIRRNNLIGKPEEEIIAQVNSEIRGLYNYYAFAHNVSQVVGSFGYVMTFSFFKTLAAKHRSSIRKINKRYRKGSDFVVKYKDKKGNEKCIVLYNGGYKRKAEANRFANIDELNHRIYTPLPTMVDRLKLGKCELCGSSSDLVMYQVRNLRLLKPDTNWHKLMIEKNRKTLAVCENCYRTIHSYGK